MTSQYDKLVSPSRNDLWGKNCAKSDNSSTQWTALAQREGVRFRLVSGDSSLRLSQISVRIQKYLILCDIIVDLILAPGHDELMLNILRCQLTY